MLSVAVTVDLGITKVDGICIDNDGLTALITLASLGKVVDALASLALGVLL